MAVKPISPKEIKDKKEQILPDAVLESFNEIIAQKYSNGYASFTQEEVIQIMLSKGLQRAAIFAKGYLRVEAIYRAQGWKVEFDRPGFNETYEARFTFSKK